MTEPRFNGPMVKAVTNLQDQILNKEDWSLTHLQALDPILIEQNHKRMHNVANILKTRLDIYNRQNTTHEAKTEEDYFQRWKHARFLAILDTNEQIRDIETDFYRQKRVLRLFKDNKCDTQFQTEVIRQQQKELQQKQAILEAQIRKYLETTSFTDIKTHITFAQC